MPVYIERRELTALEAYSDHWRELDKLVGGKVRGLVGNVSRGFKEQKVFSSDDRIAKLQLHLSGMINVLDSVMPEVDELGT